MDLLRAQVLIKGPVECRRGVVLLQPQHVDLLGGEVQELVVVNAPENVLARLVGLPENPSPVYGSYAALAPVGQPEIDDPGTTTTYLDPVPASSTIIGRNVLKKTGPVNVGAVAYDFKTPLERGTSRRSLLNRCLMSP